MGVTKQAAQKRFVPRTTGEADLDPRRGFSRFTERARNAVVTAQNEARAANNDQIGISAKKALELTFREALRMGHDDVGTEHILLALLELENGTGVLADLGIDKAAAETQITDTVAAEMAARRHQ